MATKEPTLTTMTITARSAQPCRVLPAMRPKVLVRANGMTRIRSISTQFEIVVGFSNGWAELALKKPPPLVPSSFMASWEASGPVRIDWCAPCSVVTSIDAAKVWTTPCETRKSAAMNEIGSRM